MTEFFESIQATAVLMALSMAAFCWFGVRLLDDIRRHGRTGLALPAMLAAGLLLRVAWCEWSRPEPLSDFKAYWDYAVAFRHGDFTFDTIIRHPGPAVLFYFATLPFGPHLESAWLLNLFFTAVLILTVFDLARRLAGTRAGLTAAGITAFLPQLITYTAITGSEIMAVAFSMLFLWAFIRLWQEENRHPASWIALGFLLYGTLLIRVSNILYLGLIPLMWLLCDRSRLGQWVAPFVVLAGTTGILLFSWMFHQYLVTGGAGFKLFYGSELGFACAVESRDGGYKNPSEWSFYPKVARYYEGNTIAEQIKGYELTGVEARRIIMADPARYLVNGYYRMGRVLNTAQTGIRWSEKGSDRLRSLRGKLIKRLATLSNISWKIVLYASPLALLLYRRPASPESRRILALLILYFTSWYAFNLLMALSNERYGVQAMPYVICLFAGGVGALRHSLRRPPGLPETPEGKAV